MFLSIYSSSDIHVCTYIIVLFNFYLIAIYKYFIIIIVHTYNYTNFTKQTALVKITFCNQVFTVGK